MAIQAITSALWLDKVGHQHLQVGADRQLRLMPRDEKLLFGGSMSQLGPKPVLCAAPPAGRFLSPLVGRPACHGQTADITFQLSP